jgi:alanyl-tRNA synthetase
VRAGGKHNDLEEVGHTARHHTFFEMLGNFSFGDYFKREAIEYGWEWVTSEAYLGIHPDRLYISVHYTDDEARTLWRSVAGVAENRIYGLGDRDNFWQMGDTGPCGPCSEIYVDIRDGGDPKRPRSAGQRAQGGELSLEQFVELAESGHLMEIWNLVFMQFDQAADGSRSPLPAPSVDTGAGLERIAAVMQGVRSNFDTDLFADIIACGAELVGRPYDRGPSGVSYRVLADHARAVSFLLADGLNPSKDGRGYVLRRILRRGVRHAYLLGRSEPTLAPMANVVIDQMRGIYPELQQQRDHVGSVSGREETRFLETIGDGLHRLDEIITRPAGTVSGADAFKLYDTFGFPVDLTQLIARERGWSVDVVSFGAALKRQQEQSRRARHPAGAPAVHTAARHGKFTRVKPRLRQKFVGYEHTRAETEVIAYRQAADRLALVLRENPFYVESGGQVSDTGVVRGDGWELRVDEVRKEGGKSVVLGPFDETIDPSDVEAVVDEPRRRDVERNHTATHLVHAALRSVLGTHVRQAGSVVAPDRLRFDFSHHAPVTDDELAAVEAAVNRDVWTNADVETYPMPYDKAIARGAMALFGEKYGDVVRVVDIPGVSLELCGGTHVRTTGQIGLFHFTGESGVAAGVRRIEAVTGPGAYSLVKTLDERIDEVAEVLRTSPEHVARRIEGLIEDKRLLERQIEGLLREGGSSGGDTAEEHRFGSTVLSIEESAITDRAKIGLMMDVFREQHRDAIRVIYTMGDRPGVHVAVTDDLVSKGVRAGEVAKRLAALSGGRGGGRPHFASGGVADPAKLADTRAHTPQVIAELLNAEAS